MLFGAGLARELVAPRPRLVRDDAGIRARATKLDLPWGEVVDAGYEDRTESNAAVRLLVLGVHDASPLPRAARRRGEPNKASIKIDHLDGDEDTLMAEVQRRIVSAPRARVCPEVAGAPTAYPTPWNAARRDSRFAGVLFRVPDDERFAPQDSVSSEPARHRLGDIAGNVVGLLRLGLMVFVLVVTLLLLGEALGLFTLPHWLSQMASDIANSPG